MKWMALASMVVVLCAVSAATAQRDAEPDGILSELRPGQWVVFNPQADRFDILAIESKEDETVAEYWKRANALRRDRGELLQRLNVLGDLRRPTKLTPEEESELKELNQEHEELAREIGRYGLATETNQLHEVVAVATDYVTVSKDDRTLLCIPASSIRTIKTFRKN